MLLILADFVGEVIEELDKGVIVILGSRNANGPRERRPDF